MREARHTLLANREHVKTYFSWGQAASFLWACNYCWSFNFCTFFYTQTPGKVELAPCIDFTSVLSCVFYIDHRVCNAISPPPLSIIKILGRLVLLDVVVWRPVLLDVAELRWRPILLDVVGLL